MPHDVKHENIMTAGTALPTPADVRLNFIDKS
jgi:hypothetical protein